MLEELIKLLFVLMMISFFILATLRSVSNSVDVSMTYLKYNAGLNDLRNNSYGGNSSLRICKPALVNNNPGRVCVA